VRHGKSEHSTSDSGQKLPRSLAAVVPAYPQKLPRQEPTAAAGKGQTRTHALDDLARSLPTERKGGARSRASPSNVSLNRNAAALIGRGVIERVTLGQRSPKRFHEREAYRPEIKTGGSSRPLGAKIAMQPLVTVGQIVLPALSGIGK
jgi:hypothetical protein